SRRSKSTYPLTTSIYREFSAERRRASIENNSCASTSVEREEKTPMEIFLYLIIGFFVVLIFKGFRVVQQSEIIVLERLGSYSRTITNGLNIIVPFLDKPRDMFWITDTGIRKTTRVDMRETVLDVPEQAVITKDN